jgi:hypothetical protein
MSGSRLRAVREASRFDMTPIERDRQLAERIWCLPVRADKTSDQWITEVAKLLAESRVVSRDAEILALTAERDAARGEALREAAEVQFDEPTGCTTYIRSGLLEAAKKAILTLDQSAVKAAEPK